MEVLGIDIGGSGVKGAPVNLKTGEMLTERYRIPTPQPATPESVTEVIGQIAQEFAWKGPIGCGFPGVVKRGVTYTAANLDKGWVGFALQQQLQALTGCAVTVVNDADAAGMAEMHFGAGRNEIGLVMMITLGTGVGTAGFIDGVLIPNMELGHIEMKGRDAETRVADSARERDKLNWRKWGRRVGKYLARLEFLLSPDLFIIGGGVSKEWALYEKYVQRQITTRIVPATLLNQAGIVGAALAASPQHP